MALTQQEIDAFNQVKSTVAALVAEYDTVCANIVATEKQLAELPLLPVPVSDLKAAILDMVDKAGVEYRSSLKQTIRKIAINEKSGFCLGTALYELVGSPLRFVELNAALYDGKSPGHVSYQDVLTGGSSGFVDVALAAIVGDFVKVALSSVMEDMTDADFGYGRLTPKQIGTDRATRRAAIQVAQDQLAALQANKITLADNLRQLGVSVKG